MYTHIATAACTALYGCRGPVARTCRRPTVDLVVVGRAAGEAADFDKDSINKSIKMNIPLMGPHT
jgi:hypothetical protein